MAYDKRTPIGYPGQITTAEDGMLAKTSAYAKSLLITNDVTCF